MATLIPALGSCAGRMQSGERRLAERLDQKLEDDYLLWWDVPIGPKQTSRIRGSALRLIQRFSITK